jgi:hypothetical protein
VSIDGRPFPIVWSILGGALLVAVLNLITRPRLGLGRRSWYYR